MYVSFIHFKTLVLIFKLNMGFRRVFSSFVFIFHVFYFYFIFFHANKEYLET